MKKLKFITLSTALLFSVIAFAPNASAEESNVGFSFKSGELKFNKVSDLDFGEITYNSNGDYYYPTVQLDEWMVGATVVPPDYPDFMGMTANVIPVLWPALVDISNDSTTTNWTLNVQRTPFINSVSGKELVGAGLSMGNLTDRQVGGLTAVLGDYNYINIKTDSAQKVFNHSGSAAKGRHIVSLFTTDKDLQPIGNQQPAPASYEGFTKTGTFKANNAALYIPANADIEPGQYSATLIWTLGVSL